MTMLSFVLPLLAHGLFLCFREALPLCMLLRLIAPHICLRRENMLLLLLGDLQLRPSRHPKERRQKGDIGQERGSGTQQHKLLPTDVDVHNALVVTPSLARGRHSYVAPTIVRCTGSYFGGPSISQLSDKL
ncbi:hypothetical protein B0H14DRAFT_3773541 [Mycena olivaceomarginata]|nr:hypothetical protein B0H14DRAFT_3773541 [Mycena olivaceomarginata]